MTATPNDRLRAARDAARLTQGQLADRANAQVEAATGSPGAMDADYIGKLERGVHRWPNRHYRAALRTVLQRAADADLGFFSTRSPVATVRTSSGTSTGGDDVERKAFLRVLAGSVAGLGLVDPLHEFAASPADGGRRIGRVDVDHVRQLARMFAGQDHQYGGQLSSRAVMAQLSASAELTGGAFASEQVRRDLFSAVAELADIAAGVCFDAGLHPQAERAFRFGVGCAQEAGDWAMRAKALSGLANLAVHRRRGDDALSFSEMALVRADRLTPKVAAMMHTRHARALGLVGVTRADDCRAAVDRAENSFTAARPGSEPEWIAYYDHAHLDRDAGRALLHLALAGGDHVDARHRLETSIPGFGEAHSRGKALATANLAALIMACGDPHEAVAFGYEALATVASIRSDRVNDALRGLAGAGERHVDVPAVRELTDLVRRTLSGTALA